MSGDTPNVSALDRLLDDLKRIAGGHAAVPADFSGNGNCRSVDELLERLRQIGTGLETRDAARIAASANGDDL